MSRGGRPKRSFVNPTFHPSPSDCLHAQRGHHTAQPLQPIVEHPPRGLFPGPPAPLASIAACGLVRGGRHLDYTRPIRSPVPPSPPICCRVGCFIFRPYCSWRSVRGAAGAEAAAFSVPAIRHHLVWEAGFPYINSTVKAPSYCSCFPWDLAGLRGGRRCGRTEAITSTSSSCPMA